MQGAAPGKEEAAAASEPSRKGVRRRSAPEGEESSKAAAPRSGVQGVPTPQTSRRSVQVSEKAAREAVDAGDFSPARMVSVLRKLDVPANSTRKNVIPVGQDHVQGMLLGLYSYGGAVGLSQRTSQHPWLTKLLAGALHAAAPDFPFTSIQLNYNYAARPHVDKNNLGTSFIIGLGDYTGGELWVHANDGDGQEEFTLEGDEDVTGFYHVGKRLPGQLLQIKDTWTIFDGTLLHYTKPFTGDRYSVIYFTSDRYAAAPLEARSALADAGFKFDFEAAGLEAVLQDKHRRRVEVAKQVAVERAAEERKRLLLRGRCIGRVWAGGWGLRCTAVCEENSEFCGSHIQRNRWKTHGRMDGDLPPAKRDEMAYYQQKFVAAGKLPPVREGATILVPIPGWPETERLAEAMKAYGVFKGKKAA